jgi:hypothetical protein
MRRKVSWPGNQLNDINEFREDCYKQCHDRNPTDSGWYEKTNECGENCRTLLKESEYMQGKDPCELKLQAPVFWYEPYENTEKTNTLDVIYLTLYIIMIILITLFILITIFE